MIEDEEGKKLTPHSADNRMSHTFRVTHCSSYGNLIRV